MSEMEHGAAAKGSENYAVVKDVTRSSWPYFTDRMLVHP